MADDAQVAVQVKQALALLYATGNKEADTWLQGFITQGYGRCLGPCALILDDAASQPHEALFAAAFKGPSIGRARETWNPISTQIVFSRSIHAANLRDQ